MRFPEKAVELAAALLCAATLAYQICLLSELPARSFYFLFLPLAPLALYVFLRREMRPEAAAAPRFVVVALAVLTALAGLFTIFHFRPCYDDLWYFHASLIQAEHLDEPFYRQVLFHHDPRLLGDPMRVIAAYPRVAMLLAVPLSIEPLLVYHYVAPFVAAVVMTLAYFLLLRRAGLSDGYAVAGTAFAMLFLLSDGGSVNSYGQHSLGTLWVSSRLVIGLGLPLAAYFGVEFLRRPTRWSFLRLVLANVGVTGLSSSSFFLLPLLATGLAGSAALMGWRSRRRWLTAAAACVAATAYPLAIGLTIKWMLPEQLADREVFAAGMGDYYLDDWLANLRLVYENWMRLAAFALAAFLLPVLTLGKRVGGAVALYCGLLAAVFFNPFLAPLLHDIVTRWAYYRVMYLLPLPLLAGLVPLALGRWRSARTGAIAAVVAAGLYIAGTSHGLFYPLSKYRQGYSTLGIPTGVRYFPGEIAAARALRPLVKGRRVLTPSTVAIPLGLIEPTVWLEVTRADFTRHVYETAGLPEEARRRYYAQRFVQMRGAREPEEGARALRQSIELGVDLIVTELRRATAIENVIQELGVGYETFEVAGLYRVFILGTRFGEESSGRAAV